MKAFLDWLRFLWSTRNCTHPTVRRIYGDERNLGYLYRCLPCGKRINDAGTAEVR